MGTDAVCLELEMLVTRFLAAAFHAANLSDRQRGPVRRRREELLGNTTL